MRNENWLEVLLVKVVRYIMISVGMNSAVDKDSLRNKNWTLK